jgi:pyruvate kinase
MPRRIQIIATIGPASLPLARSMAEAGATAFRLNASHFEPDDLDRVARTVRDEAPEASLIIDLQGAKMRLGRFAARSIAEDERVVFSFDGEDADALELPHRELFAQACAGETLTIDDARLAFEIVSVEPRRLIARALTSGRIAPRKGVNVIEHPVGLDDLCDRDQGTLRALGDLGGVAWAFSFMRDGRESAWLRRRLAAPFVIGKIERREAIVSLDSIVQRTDALWICRGDLGAQLGWAELAAWIGGLDPGGISVPVLMAGQVLEHLTAHRQPTRSEVCHLYDLMRRGYAGIVLSDETAIGADPLRAVRIAAELISAFIA